MMNKKIVVGCGVLLAAVLFHPMSAVAGEKAHKPKAVTPKTAQYDANKDGVLDEAEQAAMKADRAAKRHANLLKKYDANQNGQLEPEEEAIHQADLAKRREMRAEKKKAKEAVDDHEDEEAEEAPAAESKMP